MTRTVCLLLVTVACPAVASAYTGPAHVRRDRREVRDDLRDEKRAEWLLQEFQRSWKAHDRRGGQGVEARVAAALDDELRDSRQKVREQATEVHRDGLKVREDKREGMNTWDHKDPRTIGPDRRSLRDDRRDLMKEVEYRDRLRAIHAEWKDLRGDRHAGAMRRKVELLQELVRLSRYQIQTDVTELHEGQAEMQQGR